MTSNVALLDPMSRTEVISYLSGEFRAAIDAIPKDIANMTLDEIEAVREPGPTDYFLRKNLWKQVEIAKSNGHTDITAVSVYRGVCGQSNFQERVLTNPLRLAWILHAPMTETEQAEEALAFGIMRIRRDLLTMPMNAKSAPSILKAIELLWNRTRGPLIQRIDARHLHAKVQPQDQIETPEQILQKLEELKTKLLQEARPVTDEENSNPS